MAAVPRACAGSPRVGASQRRCRGGVKWAPPATRCSRTSERCGPSYHRSAGDAAHAVDPFRPRIGALRHQGGTDPPIGYGTLTTVILNSPTAPGTPRLPRLKWPGVAGKPVSTPLNEAEPGKSARHGPATAAGLALASPVITKVPPAPVHDVMSILT